ncbi:MAG: NADPH-dependent FMN reductase, partial [Deltaproteobacteria bacterium]|nr:NADPH-dependent FMN reductase [Deltaproteobacteria bacterium]
MRRALLLVGSPKAGASTSGSLGTYLLERLGEHGVEGGQRRVGEVLRAPGGLD